MPDEMSYQEAAEIMKRWLDNGSEGFTGEQLGYIEGWFHQSDIDAFKLAIKALEKEANSNATWLLEKDTNDKWFCSHCLHISRLHELYCPSCGAKMY